jgi:opacity protein-like surface antigen
VLPLVPVIKQVIAKVGRVRCAPLLSILLIVLSAGARAQSAPDALRDNPSFWVGLEYANIRAGFPYGSNLRLSGLGGVASFSWTHHMLIEGRAQYLNWNSWNGETEQDYLAGPRYTFLSGDRVRPFAHLEVGLVHIQYPFRIGSGNMFAVVPGGGLEYRLNRRWSVRASYEYQILPVSPNFTDEPRFGILPNGVFAGFTYRVF